MWRRRTRRRASPSASAPASHRLACTASTQVVKCYLVCGVDVEALGHAAGEVRIVLVPVMAEVLRDLALEPSPNVLVQHIAWVAGAVLVVFPMSAVGDGGDDERTSSVDLFGGRHLCLTGTLCDDHECVLIFAEDLLDVALRGRWLSGLLQAHMLAKVRYV